MQFSLRSRRWLVGSIISAGVIAAASYGVFAIYAAAREQARRPFVPAATFDVNEFFPATPEVVVKEQLVGAEPGYVANKGPVRVSTAYRALFDKDTLVKFVEWIYDNVNWGANGLSLNLLTFTSGIDSRAGGSLTTLGFHTAGREGSGIFMSPDAFESTKQIGARLFTQYWRDHQAEYVSAFTAAVGEAAKASELVNPISDALDADLQLYFNNVQVGEVGTANYHRLSTDEITAVLSTLLTEMIGDNFISGSVVNSSLATLRNNWANVTAGNYLNDGVLSSVARLTRAAETKQMAALVDASFADRFATVLAWKLVRAATNGAQSVANAFLTLDLWEILTAPDEQLEGGALPTYRATQPDEWEARWQTVRASLVRDYGNESIARQHEYVYRLFTTYHALAREFFARPAAADAFAQIPAFFTNSKTLFLRALYDASALPATERTRLLLSGEWRATINLPLYRRDAFLLRPEEEWRLTSNAVADRTISLPSPELFKSLITEDLTTLNNGQTVSAYYRDLLLGEMRYTIAHEYGHHETLWQLSGASEPFYKMHNNESAAKGEEIYNQRLFDRLDAIGKTSRGIGNAVQLIKRANDLFSASWTPSYYLPNYLYYTTPAVAGQTGVTGWVQNFTNLYQANANAVLTGSFGQVPIGRDTTGNDGWTNFGWNETSLYRYRVNPQELPAPPGNLVLGSFLPVPFELSRLLTEYQFSRWVVAGRASDSPANVAWRRANGIVLPDYTVSFYEPTTRYMPIVIQAGISASLQSALEITQNIGPAAARYITDALDQLVATYYDEIIAQYPNFFEAVGGEPALSPLERSNIILDDLHARTVAVVAKAQLPVGTNPTEALSATGIYLRPESPLFTTYIPTYQTDALWSAFARDEFVTTGLAGQGSAISGFSDYTGSYSEFLTRAWNQLGYRPEIARYLRPGAPLGVDQYFNENEGWVEDAARFHAQGLDLYNFDLGASQNTMMTEAGAKLLMWFRETLGLQSSLDLLAPLPRTSAGEIDFAALDASLIRANVVEKVFKNPRSGMYAMWGWLPSAVAANYQYLVLVQNGRRNYVPIKTQNTSNYFYYTDLTSEHRRSLNPNFTQWVSEYMVLGDYDNSVARAGTGEIFFARDLTSPLESVAVTTTGTALTRHNNDYRAVVTQVVVTVDPDNRRTMFTVRANG